MIDVFIASLSLLCKETKRERTRRFVSCVDLFSIVTEFHSLFAILLVRLVTYSWILDLGLGLRIALDLHVLIRVVLIHVLIYSFWYDRK